MTKQNKKDNLLYKLGDLEDTIREGIKGKNYAARDIELLDEKKQLTNNEKIEYIKAIKDYKKAKIGLDKAVIKYAQILTTGQK